MQLNMNSVLFGLPSSQSVPRPEPAAADDVPVAPDAAPDPLAAALHVLGFESFKPGQRDVVESVLAGAPTLAIMPTGAGKSLCYQLPSILLPGVTLVVSPLLALIRDQVARAQARGLAVTSLTSVDGRDERSARLSRIARREVKLVYAAPEGLRSPVIQAALKEAGVSLLVVDEAHCISAWGHDFRPDYARLGQVREVLRPERVLAVTATATASVQQDIVRSLNMAQARVIITGFDRPNLRLSVVTTRGAQDKMLRVAESLRQNLAGGGSAIVYCATRRMAEEVADGLKQEKLSAVAYHAGLPPPAREAAQGAWERGEVPVICATTAFGMGVDKPDVRVVIHHAIPRAPEAYYQEVGRAGRDGLPAVGLLLFDAGDVRLAQHMLSRSCPTELAVRRAYAQCWKWQGPDGVCAESLDMLCERLGNSVEGGRAALVHLQQTGALAMDLMGVSLTGPAPEALLVDGALLEARARSEQVRLSAMLAYVNRVACRRAFLVDYFSAGRAEACGSCDLCSDGAVRPVDEAARVDVLKALSCVARMQGRFGRARVADVLCGSHARAVMEARLHELSTYGLFKDRARGDVLDLLGALERNALVATAGGEFPVLEVTAQGQAVLDSQEVPPMWLPQVVVVPAARVVAEEGRPAARVAAEDPPEMDAALWERLRAWRSNAAREQRVPPYVLFHDKTLKAIAALKPRSAVELVQVPGLGRAKVQRYGSALLELVRAS